jgi:glutamine amidotransferase
MDKSKGDITILDLGINNISSVKRAFQQSNQGTQINIQISDSEFGNTRLVVLPGLGSFASGMAQLQRRKLDKYLLRARENKIAIVGVCLGMQLLGLRSEESPNVEGLGLIRGENKILPINSNERIPNVGWMGVKPQNGGSTFSSLAEGKDFYFVHSYYFIPTSDKDCILKSMYGDINITTGIMNGRVLGFQFHPEKSSAIGAQLIKEISNWGLNEN